jgi:hypothetical protein
MKRSRRGVPEPGRADEDNTMKCPKWLFSRLLVLALLAVGCGKTKSYELVIAGKPVVLTVHRDTKAIQDDIERPSVHPFEPLSPIDPLSGTRAPEERHIYRKHPPRSSFIAPSGRHHFQCATGCRPHGVGKMSRAYCFNPFRSATSFSFARIMSRHVTSRFL